VRIDRPRLVALDYEYDDPHDPSGDQTPPTAALSASVLRPTGERLAWSPVERLPAPDGGAELTSHACGGGGAFVLSQLVDRRQVIVRFDGTGWSTVPSPPVWLGISAPSAWTGHEWLVWTNDPLQPQQPPTIVAFRLSTRTWSTVAGTALPSEVVPAGDAVVQYTFGSGRMSLEVVER
jgi:hypothetical protein